MNHSFLRPSGKAGNVKAGNGIQSLRKAGNEGNFLGTVKFIEYKLIFTFSPPQAPPNGIFRLPSKNWRLFWSWFPVSKPTVSIFLLKEGREREGREWERISHEGREFPPFPAFKAGNRKLWARTNVRMQRTGWFITFHAFSEYFLKVFQKLEMKNAWDNR